MTYLNFECDSSVMDNNWKYIFKYDKNIKYVGTHSIIERQYWIIYFVRNRTLFTSNLYKHISNGDRTLGQVGSEDNQASNFHSATLQPDQGPSWSDSKLYYIY